MEFDRHQKSSVPVDLISMLVVGSSYENKKRIPNSEVDEYGFKVFEEPEPDYSSDEVNWFCFRTETGQTVRVRQLELARALFFHNFHLSRTAFRHNGLAGLGRVERSQDATVIKLSEMADFPPSNLQSRSSLVHLSWLFLDKSASQSFGSILRLWQQSECNIWSFRFSPPLLKSWKISGTGFYEKGESGATFTIEEITRLHNPVFAHQKRIIVDHPAFKERLGKKNGNGKRPTIPNQSKREPELVLDLEPLLGDQLEQVSDSGFVFSFDDTLDVGVQVNGKRYRVKPRVEGEAEAIVKTVSPGHASEYGSGRELDYGINRADEIAELQDETLVEVEPTSRFENFEEAVCGLGSRPDFKILQKTCFQLPWPRSSSLTAINTATGEPIQAFVVEARCREISVLIFEVDVENLLKPHAISSLVVSSNGDENEKIRRLLHSCSTHGVNWKANELKNFGVRFRKVSHPPRVTNRRGIANRVPPWRYQERWTGILESKIRELVKEVESSQPSMDS